MRARLSDLVFVQLTTIGEGIMLAHFVRFPHMQELIRNGGLYSKDTMVLRIELADLLRIFGPDHRLSWGGPCFADDSIFSTYEEAAAA